MTPNPSTRPERFERVFLFANASANSLANTQPNGVQYYTVEREPLDTTAMHDARPRLQANDPRRYDWQHVARRRSLDHAACLMGPLDCCASCIDWR